MKYILTLTAHWEICFLYYRIFVSFIDILWSTLYVTDSTIEHSDDPVLLKLFDKQVHPKFH